MYPYIYKATICSEFNDYKEEVKSGCTFGKNFTEAMHNIEEYYGDELVDIHIDVLEEGETLEFFNYEEADNIVKNY